MAALPHPWDEYSPLQTELDERTRVDSETWGLEEALNNLIDPAARKRAPSPQVVKRVRNAASRRERYRAHLRVLRVVQIAGPADPEVEYQAIEVRETLDFLQAQVKPDDWTLLQEIAGGCSYAELAKMRGGTEGSLRVRMSRLRTMLKKAA